MAFKLKHFKDMNAESTSRLRKSLGLNQDVFWETVGSSQSAGSRYESGEAPIPEAVQVLLTLAYFPRKSPKIIRALLDRTLFKELDKTY